MTDRLQIEFLGTGTSAGVPQLLCGCGVCRSTDPRDKRLRSSAIVRYKGTDILIDCGPDFRTQMLRATDSHLDALLLTHIHYDHVGGIDDLRSYSVKRPFPVFARHDVIRDLHTRLPYCFSHDSPSWVPMFEMHEIDERPFSFRGITIEPIPVMHYKLPIFGYRIGPLAYITDCKTIEDRQVDKLRGVPLLVVNALCRHEHISHMNLEQALRLVGRINPGRAFLIHMSHDIGFHADYDSSSILPGNVRLAYDGLVVEE